MKIGDIYPTRDGRKAKVVEIIGNEAKDLVRIEIINPVENYWVFQNDGTANHNIVPRPYDLILPPKTIKAQQVIEYEGPEEAIKRELKYGWGSGIDEEKVERRKNLEGDVTIREVSRKFL